MTDYTAVVLDTETSAQENGDVLQLAYLPLDSNFNDAGEYKCTYHLPTKPIEWGAMAVHHLDEVHLKEVGALESRAVAPSAEYYIGHNIDFDVNALGGSPAKRICTLALARYHWQDTLGHSLGACTYRISKAAEARVLLRNAHDAVADVLLCYELFRYFVRVFDGKSLEGMWRLSEAARIPIIMPFGKHKGKRIADIDRGYKTWAFKQPDFDPYVLEAFRQTM